MKPSRSSRKSSPLQRQKIQCIGHYDLVKTIGQGQFGKVKLARHVLTGEKVAVKIIKKSKLDEKSLAKVYREVRVMKMLNHPNVIKLYEVVETDNVLFLMMEYASGGEVLDLIVAHGKLDEDLARKFFSQLVEAVDYCHKRYVIHRDIKCENLLLTEDRTIKVIDFGLSNSYSPGSLLNTFCGSPTYCAPELVQRKEYNGPEVDVWSMGVVLFVLVCGYLPFDGRDFRGLFLKILSGKYVMHESVSEGCRDLISRMLEVDSQKRISLAEVRQHPWMMMMDQWNNASASLEALVPRVVVNDGQDAGANASSPSSLPSLSGEEDEVDSSLIDQMASLGFARDSTRSSVLSRKYDAASATYALLLERKRRASRESSPRRRGAPPPSGFPVHHQRNLMSPVHPATTASGASSSSAAATATTAATDMMMMMMMMGETPRGAHLAPSSSSCATNRMVGPTATSSSSTRGSRGHRRHHTADVTTLNVPAIHPAPLLQPVRLFGDAPPSASPSSAASGAAMMDARGGPAKDDSSSAATSSGVGGGRPRASSSSNATRPLAAAERGEEEEASRAGAGGRQAKGFGGAVRDDGSSSATATMDAQAKPSSSSMRTARGVGDGGGPPPSKPRTRKNLMRHTVHGRPRSTSGRPAKDSSFHTLSRRASPSAAMGFGNPRRDAAMATSPLQHTRKHHRGGAAASSGAARTRGKVRAARRHPSADHTSSLSSSSANKQTMKTAHQTSRGASTASSSSMAMMEKRGVGEGGRSSTTLAKPEMPHKRVHSIGAPLVSTGDPSVARGGSSSSSTAQPSTPSSCDGSSASSSSSGAAHRRGSRVHRRAVSLDVRKIAMEASGEVASTPSDASLRGASRGRYPSRGATGNAQSSSSSTTTGRGEGAGGSFWDSVRSGFGLLASPIRAAAPSSSLVEDGDDASSAGRRPSSSSSTHTRAGRSEPRTFRFAFNMHTTSSKSPRDILAEVVRVLTIRGIPHIMVNDYSLQGRHEKIVFEVEVCKLPILSLNGLRLARISGNVWHYKELCAELVKQMDL